MSIIQVTRDHGAIMADHEARSLRGILSNTSSAVSTCPDFEYPAIIVIHMTVFLSGISSNRLQVEVASEGEVVQMGTRAWSEEYGEAVEWDRKALHL
ncbi:hypothetical protein Acr_18g0002210 [Actinidia rufa]|uniref:Uncharacterized protein n=1 Tax=Actinidia rufa TaxID=165716 RepID=A0A7J0G5I9_9ERIC|nr:hypothetical protein Acr_18g0002210 [Actinidia rufa]